MSLPLYGRGSHRAFPFARQYGLCQDRNLGRALCLTNTLEIMKTEEGNKLIADFMGMKYNPELKRAFIDGKWRYRTLHFDTDWNWMMSAVKKVEATDDGYYDVRIMGSYCEILTLDEDVIVQMSERENPKITATWLAVVEFIEWYNTQK
jgi:hypothetical protein